MLCLDHNAGGRLRAEVRACLEGILAEDLGNPSSAHAAGRRARERIEEARDEVAALAGAKAAEVVFTSGATEANNLAVQGLAAPGRGIVSTAIEHPSLLRACDAAEARGGRVARLAPDGAGRIAVEAVVAAVEAETALVSIGWANGEIGTVQPVRAIAAAVRRQAGRQVAIHSDAAQAAAFVPLEFGSSDLDLLTLSGHKLGGLSGVGALVVRSGVALRPLLHGGPQERERRAGTENVLGIASFGAAARLARREREEWVRRARALRDRLLAGLVHAVAPLVRFGAEDGLPNTLSLAFPGLRGDALAIALDLRGVAISTGSACAAGAAEPSPVLLALGCDEPTARGAIRLSLGPELREDDVDRAAAEIATAVRRARTAAAAPVSGPPSRGRLHDAA